MRIISKHSDYYDCVQKFASDDPNVYLRISKRETITPDDSLKELLVSFWKTYLDGHVVSRKYTIDITLIGFCGKVYPALRISYTEKLKDYVEYIYDIEHMDKLVDGVHDKKLKELYTKQEYRRWKQKASLRDDIKSFFDKWYGSTKFENLFWEFKSPIFTLRNTCEHRFRINSYYNTINGDMSFVVNGSLKNYNFQKVFDPYLAYQEVEMYYFGVLGCTEKDTVQISDLDMRNQKGFDKMSFKKSPTKRKPK